MTTERYTAIYDESDFILDNETGEYYTIEEACNLLNDMNEWLNAIGSFFETIVKKLDYENTVRRNK